MTKQAVQTLLERSQPKEIVVHIITSYREVEQNYRLEKWKTSELDAGHFVEAVRRLIEYKLKGAYTPFTTAMGSFNQSELNRYESATGVEEYRIIIPRVDPTPINSIV
jgi:hypothetical protein